MVVRNDAQLSTRLLLPDNPLNNPPPVLILVHGSGEDADWTVYQSFVERLTNKGFAVAFYDKRGTGNSTGKFLDISVKKSTEIFNILSNDVVAVAEWVSTQAGIDPSKIGVFGLSQGGWIAPLAVNKSDKISFSIIMSGPVCSLGQEKLYSKLMGDESRPPKAEIADANEAVRVFEGKQGFSSLPEIQKMKIPGLWLFGEKDFSMPSHLSKKNLEQIIGAHNKDSFIIKLYPNANHSLFDIDRNERLNYLDNMVSWVRSVF